MASDFLLTDTNLASLRQRAIALAEAHGFRELANALSLGCTPLAFRVLQRLPHDAQAVAFYLLLEDVPGREACAHRLAAINHVGQPSERFPLPGYSIGTGAADFADSARALRQGVRTAATAMGRDGPLATIYYLALSAAASRWNALDPDGAVLKVERETVLGTMATVMEVLACAGVVDDRIDQVDDLREAFALTLRGLSPLDRDVDGWKVKAVWP